MRIMESGGKGIGNRLVSQLGACLVLLGFFFPTYSSFPHEKHTSYEVIIPRQLIPTKEDDHAYIIKAAGKEYIIRLKPKMHFPVQNFPVFTYDSQGKQIESQPYISRACYYEGHVEGIMDSLVTLSTCNGLKGYLKISDKDYGIKPIKDSSTFQHLLYLMEDLEANSSGCGMRGEEAERQAEEPRRRASRSHKDRHTNPTHPKYIEIYIVVDHAMFLIESANETIVLQLVLDVLNMVDAHYRPLNVHITIMGLEIWTNGNYIGITKDITTTLNDFNTWKLAHFDMFPHHDTTHLFFHQNFSDSFGKAFQGGICRQELAVGVEAYVESDLILFVKAVSHELGHHLGLVDDDHTCFCGPYQDCIMSSYYSTVSMFSNCSFNTFLELALLDKLECLRNVPHNVEVVKRCGNSVLDIGEDCDCGGPEQCRGDECCNPDCTFKGKATCSTGPCCKNCRYLPSGQICRAKVSECDLPEYCPGDSQWCRTDLYVQDGTPCSEQASFCYEKKCWTHNFLCARVFGEESRVAPESCFRALNTVGSAIGNCGGNRIREEYVKCKVKDVLCGRIHCTDVEMVPNDIKFMKIVRVPLAKTQCWSIDYQGEVDRYDLGVVPDGTMCGPKRICMNRTCIPATILRSQCNPEKKCSGRGVCNNNNNCHCNVGWAPPFCKYWGTGGSIDGGFPLMTWSTSLVRYTFGTIIPLALLSIAAITVIVPKLLSMIPKLAQSRGFRSRTIRISQSSMIESTRDRGRAVNVDHMGFAIPSRTPV
ncbi:disintegrin and metalloproteinase domain-containing protein 21-like [Anolis carolinensis]|uniref:disintegrin and metalloproteinase domain-containing protein 21-like n=1 Tax=Anolis carolinensis TaxID=28377 RepID=UPI002F2B6373